MDKSNSTILINQTLHGYSSGHSLLESSLSLSPIDDRRMLLLSDMSGPSMTKGFEEYLTGYPLAERSTFVLSKTWYAPEMGRPGCVWTHSLLIDFADLAAISSPQVLLRYFSHPDNLNTTSNYSKVIKLSLSDGDDSFSQFETFPSRALRPIIYALYHYPEKQIFVPVDDANSISKYEQILLGVWEYQGARLRSRFLFCSGSIENRSSSDITFDLQIIPERNREKIEQKNGSGIFLGYQENKNNDYPNWIDYVAGRFIGHRFRFDLKSYLNACDSDISDSRSGYSKLLRIYSFCEQDLDIPHGGIEKLVSVIADEFPKQDEAGNLKSFLLGSKIIDSPPVRSSISQELLFGDSWLPSYIPEQESLIALCTTRSYNAFNPDDLQIRTRARKLILDDNRDEIIKLASIIVQSDITPLGEILISEIAENLDLQDILQIANNNESVLNLILYHNPRLGLKNILWEAPEDLQKERLDRLLSSPYVNATDVSELIRFCLEAEMNLFAPSLFAKFPTLATETTLEWVNEKASWNKVNLAQEWNDQLRMRVTEIMNWLAIGQPKAKYKTLAFISYLLDARSRKILEYGTDIWLQSLDFETDNILNSDDIYFCTFLLSVAFSSDGTSAEEIISRTFLIVYNAAKESRMPYESWQNISSKLPELPLFQSWDKCEKLRRGLLRRFVNERIDSRHFFRATNQEDVFDRILQYAVDHKKTRDFIQNEIFDSKYLSPIQQKISKRYF